MKLVSLLLVLVLATAASAQDTTRTIDVPSLQPVHPMELVGVWRSDTLGLVFDASRSVQYLQYHEGRDFMSDPFPWAVFPLGSHSRLCIQQPAQAPHCDDFEFRGNIFRFGTRWFRREGRA